MDLRVSVVLLFVFLTGGYSLKCYSCMPDLTGYCKATVETCPAGHSECASSTVTTSVGSKVSITTKFCASHCNPGTKQTYGGSLSIRCCDTDLCNAADGMYKGSFVLLFSPLLFYFMFQ